ncbi:MAG: phosphatase PAP2 family protein [Bacteroidaceae bacterium]
MKRYKILITLLAVNSALPTSSKDIDSLNITASPAVVQEHKRPSKAFNWPSVLIPSAFISIGIIGLKSPWLKYQNKEIRDELQENIDHRITLDDYAQYVPAVATFALDACGVKAKHSLTERIVVLATAAMITECATLALKTATRIERPDGSAHNSFPSGHTATAFLGAEMVWQEYHEVSPWIGIAGYTVASGTGLFRMYNNRHWLTDVLAGAGIGIISTKTAYLLYPVFSKLFHRKNKPTIAVPFYDGRNVGIAIHTSF